MPSPPGARDAAAAGPPEPLLRPASAEIDARVPRLPPRQEPGDGRVQRDAVELVRREEPMAAHGLVARHCALERSIKLAGEDDMDDVLRPEAAFRRDRLDDRDRPLDGQLLVITNESRLLRQLALQRVDERLPA